MRIISGKHGGRVLKSFKGDDVRPTSDRAKEALFNIFKDEIRGKTFLDLFCGSGSVGIEALSRGALVTMCDVSQDSVELTKANLALIKEDCRVIRTDALAFLSSVKERFDFIFLDPPYASDIGIAALKKIDEDLIVSGGGYVIYERDREEAIETVNLVFIRSRKYGKNVFSIYKAKDTI